MRCRLPPKKLTSTLLPGERARDVLEDDAGRVLVVQDDLGGHADVLLPGEPFDFADLAELTRLCDPLPQVGVGDLWPGAGSCGARPRGFGGADGIPHPGVVFCHRALHAPSAALRRAAVRQGECTQSDCRASYTPGMALNASSQPPSRVCGHGIASTRSNRA